MAGNRLTKWFHITPEDSPSQCEADSWVQDEECDNDANWEGNGGDFDKAMLCAKHREVAKKLEQENP
jgi:hypothetical protein